MCHTKTFSLSELLRSCCSGSISIATPYICLMSRSWLLLTNASPHPLPCISCHSERTFFSISSVFMCKNSFMLALSQQTSRFGEMYYISAAKTVFNHSLGVIELLGLYLSVMLLMTEKIELLRGCFPS